MIDILLGHCGETISTPRMEPLPVIKGPKLHPFLADTESSHIQFIRIIGDGYDSIV